MQLQIDGSTIEVRGMRAEEAGERQHLHYLSYREYADGPNDPRYYPSAHGRLQYVDPTMKPEQNRVLFCDGKMVSSISVYLWKSRFNGFTPTAGLIGGVCTHPDYRRRGFVKILMKDVVQYIREQQCELSWLYGRSEVYSSSGFKTWCGYCTLYAEIDTTRLRDDHDAGATNLRARPVERHRDTPALMEIYEEWNRGLSGPILRSHDVWIERVLGPDAKEGSDRFFVVEDGSRCIGYFQLLDDAVIGELGARDDENAKRTIAELARKTGGPVTFTFCFDRFERLVREMPGTVSRNDGQRHGMWMLFDGSGLGLGRNSDTDELLSLLDTLEFVYYRMDRF